MQRLIDIQGINTTFKFIKTNKNNKKVIGVKRNSKKDSDNKIEQKLLRAERQIEEGRTIEGEKVFRELEEEYGF